jgi:hypothetical protein
MKADTVRLRELLLQNLWIYKTLSPCEKAVVRGLKIIDENILEPNTSGTGDARPLCVGGKLK